MIANFFNYKVLKLLKNNKTVLENYLFMTVLQILNSFFYLLIYPYLIKSLGIENYGLFVFASSVVNNFLFLINFGFDLPATKIVAENIDNKAKQRELLSIIFTAKNYLFLFSSFIFFLGINFLPILQKNYVLLIICFFSIYSTILFPQWFFQGMQEMRVVTFIQLTLKILSLPIIFLCVKYPTDLILYATIITATNILVGIISYLYIFKKYNILIGWKNHKTLKIWFKKGLPFFYSELANYVKDGSVPIIIGAFFSMRDVAIYDLANKLVMIPKVIFMKINAAIFPKLIINISSKVVKKVILIEFFISLSGILGIIIFGKYVINYMSHGTMSEAYYLAICLSTTVMTWLLVGAIINFVFVPSQKYYLITKNQIIALISFLLFTLIGIYFYPKILTFGLAFTFSGLIEILVCLYFIKKYHLL